MPTKPAPTASTMRLDGGHPALELVNTVHADADGRVEHDVLARPRDLVDLTVRLGMAEDATASSTSALHDARSLRDALDSVLRGRIAGAAAPATALALLEECFRTANAAARLDLQGAAYGWHWPPHHADTPVHRLALAAIDLLTGPDLARLRSCAGCNWVFLDRSRGSGRRWCSMADCGTESKKRRYVQRRRQRRHLEENGPS